MAYTKQKILERLMEDMNLNRGQAGEVLEIFLEIMKHTLETGEDIMISGFGKFCVKEKAPRKGRNPATNSPMILPRRRTVRFKVAEKLKDRING